MTLLLPFPYRILCRIPVRAVSRPNRGRIDAFSVLRGRYDSALPTRAHRTFIPFNSLQRSQFRSATRFYASFGDLSDASPDGNNLRPSARTAPKIRVSRGTLVGGGFGELRGVLEAGLRIGGVWDTRLALDVSRSL
ncbi:hypothetical protein MKEN_00858200 [Mycena kentingensis (nom. inval.)]|nr:hypothetical protein MKEN_00858200 [Mycena kentingensis (nom. inval.)]